MLAFYGKSRYIVIGSSYMDLLWRSGEAIGRIKYKKHSSFIKEGFLQTEPIALKRRIYYATTSIMLVIPNLEAGALAAVAAFIVAGLVVVGAAAGGIFIAAEADGRGFFFVVFVVVVIVPRPGAEALHRWVLDGGGVVLHFLLFVRGEVSLPGEAVVVTLLHQRPVDEELEVILPAGQRFIPRLTGGNPIPFVPPLGGKGLIPPGAGLGHRCQVVLWCR